MRALVALCVLAGCRQLLSLDDIPGPAGGRVTGRYLSLALVSSADGSPIVDARPMALFGATVDLGDGADRRVELADDGTFAFDTFDASEPYRLRFITGRGIRELQHAARHIELSEPTRRDDLEVVGANTVLAYELQNPPTAATSAFVRVTGVPSSYCSLARITTAGYTCTWPSGAPRLLAEKHDRAYFTIEQPVPEGYTAVTAFRSDELTLQSGATNAVSTPLAPAELTALDRQRCVHVRSDTATQLARLADAGYTGTPKGGWGVVDLPQPTLGFFGTQVLAYQNTVADVSADVMFDDPYQGQHLAAYYTSAYVTHPHAVGGATTNIGDGIWTYVLPRMQGCGNAEPEIAPIAISGRPTLGGVELVTDGMMVTINRAGPVRLAWTILSTGSVEQWTVQLYEVTAAGTTLTFSNPISYRTYALQPQVTIPPSDFVKGKSYIISIDASIGAPGTQDGDFATRSFPAADQIVYSDVFKIAN